MSCLIEGPSIFTADEKEVLYALVTFTLQVCDTVSNNAFIYSYFLMRLATNFPEIKEGALQVQVQLIDL